jgi:hypothetical protein
MALMMNVLSRPVPAATSETLTRAGRWRLLTLTVRLRKLLNLPRSSVMEELVLSFTNVSPIIHPLAVSRYVPARGFLILMRVIRSSSLQVVGKTLCWKTPSDLWNTNCLRVCLRVVIRCVIATTANRMFLSRLSSLRLILEAMIADSGVALETCRCYPFVLMPTEHILSLLISERDKLNRAIEALGEPVKRRGRPVKAAQAPVEAASVAEPSKRRNFSPAQRRRRQAQRMKAYWAAKRKNAGKTVKTAVAKSAPAASAAKRKPMTAAQKKALSVKMKAAWAKRKAAA